MSKSFISLGDLTLYEYHALLDLAQDIQKNPDRFRKRLSDRSLALLCIQSAPDIQAAFELGIRQMNGTSILVDTSDLGNCHQDVIQDLLKNLKIVY